MKTLFNNIYALSLASLLGIIAVSCNDDDKYVTEPITPAGVALATDPDLTVTEANLGDMIVINGTGLDSHNIDSIKINDVAVDMAEIYTENNRLFMKIPVLLPNVQTDKVYIYNSHGCFDIDLKVNIPPLALERMFNEYTPKGDTIMVYGNFFDLYDISPETAYAEFDGLRSEIITHNNTSFTCVVPEDTPDNATLKLVSTKRKAEAICPGRYRDKRFIVFDFDNGLGNTGNKPSNLMQYIETDTDDPIRISDNYLHIYPGNFTITGWDYITNRTNVKYTDEMLDYPSNSDKFVLKFEFRTTGQIVADKIKFFCYYYWNAPMSSWPGESFNVQSFNKWETITIPFELNPAGNALSYMKEFNIRVEIDRSIAFDFAIDNIRVCPKGD